MKTLNPYVRLLADIREFVSKLKTSKRVESAVIPDLDSKSYNFRWLHERVVAANQLGYNTEIVATKDGGVAVVFVERVVMPHVPWNWTRR